MGAGDEGGVIVSDDSSSVFGDGVEGVVGVGFGAAEIEDVTDAGFF